MSDHPDPEALARVLMAADGHAPDESPFPLRITRWWGMAERIIADPGPLLAALAEAGVLTEEHVVPHLAGVFPLPGARRRYVTEWRPAG